MRYENMAKKQLINELGKLYQHISKLEILKDKYEQSLGEIELLEQKMEFILGVTKTRMDIIDSEFNIHYVDRESQKIYGDPKGRRCYEYSLGRNEPCLDCQIVKAMRTKSPIVSERILPMENNRPVQVITVPFQNDKGEWFVAEIKVDITERKKAEEALHQYIRELQNRNEELDAFAHTVSHDLKNPLTTIITCGRILEDKLAHISDEKIFRYSHKIIQFGNKMNSIIDELLLLSSVRKMEEVKRDPLNMKIIVDESLKRLAYLIEERQAAIILPKKWPIAIGYGPWIEEIWVNYLSNAIKYGGSPPYLELGAKEQRNGMVRFWIKDNGPGISHEDQACLFLPFTQIHQTHLQGQGLGLSIVCRIVKKLGGEVQVESQVDHGSVFSFTLPGSQHKSIGQSTHIP